jgi:hypothetical protein
MASSTVTHNNLSRTHENHSRLINALADQRAAIFANVWAEGGRDFTAAEQGTLDMVNNALLFATPETRTDAGAVLETAIEQLQLFNHGDTDVSLEAVEAALFRVLHALAAAGDYQPAVFQREDVIAAH